MPTLTTDDGVRLHYINFEAPKLFNRLLGDFLHRVEAGRWAPRDPRAAPALIWGPNGKP